MLVIRWVVMLHINMPKLVSFSTTLASIIFLLVLSVTLCITFSIHPNDYGSSRAKIFITMFTGLSIVVTFLFYYGSAEIQQRQSELFIIQQTDQGYNNALHELMEEMKKASKVIPQFVSELMNLHTVEYNDGTTEELIWRASLSNKIFSWWQTTLISQAFLYVCPRAFLTRCLRYAQSPILYQEWQQHRLLYNKETQRFGDLLFTTDCVENLLAKLPELSTAYE